MNIKEKAVDLKNNIKKHGLLFHYNIIADHLLGVGYVNVRWLPCIFLECLRKLFPPCNRIPNN